MFALAKAFLADVVAAYGVNVAVATPLPGLALCNFIITTDDAIPAGTNLLAAFNKVIDDGLLNQLPPNTPIGNIDPVFSSVGAKKFRITTSIGVSNQFTAQSAVFGNNIAGFTDTVTDTNTLVATEWTVESAVCDA